MFDAQELQAGDYRQATAALREAERLEAAIPDLEARGVEGVERVRAAAAEQRRLAAEATARGYAYDTQPTTPAATPADQSAPAESDVSDVSDAGAAAATDAGNDGSRDGTTGGAPTQDDGVAVSDTDAAVESPPAEAPTVDTAPMAESDAPAIDAPAIDTSAIDTAAAPEAVEPSVPSEIDAPAVSTATDAPEFAPEPEPIVDAGASEEYAQPVGVADGWDA